MMKSSRLEAFSDGILAIIFTIMVLEFKVPNNGNIQAIFHEFPYFISYTIGWLFLGEAWYNHLFIFSRVKRVTHKLFLVNGFWLFTSSFLPLATAWIGNDLYARGPEIFYGIVFFIWTFAFWLLVQTAIHDNEQLGRHTNAQTLKAMSIYRYLTNPIALGLQLIAWVFILIFAPQFQLAIMIWQILFVDARNNVEIDKRHKTEQL